MVHTFLSTHPYCCPFLDEYGECYMAFCEELKASTGKAHHTYMAALLQKIEDVSYMNTARSEFDIEEVLKSVREDVVGRHAAV